MEGIIYPINFKDPFKVKSMALDSLLDIMSNGKIRIKEESWDFQWGN